jgi:hypothetical protein|tara:strand:- start:7321 stop:7512 length:192 start_codon:yes stop_codon:yes gene_type:complete
MSKLLDHPFIISEFPSLEYFLNIFGKPPGGGSVGFEKETIFVDEQEAKTSVKNTNGIRSIRLL